MKATYLRGVTTNAADKCDDYCENCSLHFLLNVQVHIPYRERGFDSGLRFYSRGEVELGAGSGLWCDALFSLFIILTAMVSLWSGLTVMREFMIFCLSL